MSGLESFLERCLGPRKPEFGASEEDVQSVKMPAPLQRFFRFAGRWPGHNPETPYANRFCMQDKLCRLRSKGYALGFEVMDDRLIFVWENQGVWVAATERSGEDPPVWISEDSSHREPRREWRELENPLSHFLVSFVLQEILFGSEMVHCAPDVLAKFENAGAKIEPVWLDGEYAWEFCSLAGRARPSYFLAADGILIRRAPEEADGEDWYGCNTADGAVGGAGVPYCNGVREGRAVNPGGGGMRAYCVSPHESISFKDMSFG